MNMKKGTAIYAVNEWLHENCKRGEKLVFQSSPNTLVIMKNAVFAYKIEKSCTKMLECKGKRHGKLCPLFKKKVDNSNVV